MGAPKGHPNYDTEGLAGRPYAHSDEDLEKYASELEVWMKDPQNIWLKDFALERDIDTSYLSEWAKRHKRFRQVYSKAKDWQESKLTKNSLFKRFDQRMTAMVLANHHGWTEKPTQIVVQDTSLTQFKEKLNKEKNPLLKKKDK